MKVAIQGLEASFHAIAARRLFGQSCQLIPCQTFREVFERTKNGEADRAVVAIENSLYGSINDVYDLLLRYKFWIQNEVYEQISLHLVGTEGTRLSDITDVYSQAPALAEADVFLDTHLPKAERHEHTDTALAAKEVAQWQDSKKAAIASEIAAQDYGLAILRRNIETHHDNYTRFIALSPATAEPAPSSDKTSITFETSDTPGSLHAALGVFAGRGINLTKLESRPIIGKAWQYMYYVDCAAQLDSTVLDDLQRHATNIHVLGSYPSGVVEKA